MKKIIALLLALLMAFAVSGCAESLQQIEIPPFPTITPTPRPQAQEQQGTAGAESTETPAPTGDVFPPEGSGIPGLDKQSRILMNIGRTELTDYDPDEGKEQILVFSYEMPRVYMEEHPEVAERINETLATLEETFYTGDSYGGEGRFLGYSAMLEAAEDNYRYVYDTNATGIPLEFSDTLTARVNRATDGVLSVVYAENVYMGGAHGSYGSLAYNFDTETGELLTLDRLSGDPEALFDFLVQEMLDLAEKDEEGYYSERIVDGMVPEGGEAEAFRALLREGSWYFDLEGLTIFSRLEELGPYAAGIVEFHIPYERLDGHIDAKWLCPATRQGKGRVEVVPLSEMEGGDTEIVDMLMVNEGGESLCVLVDGSIYDVSIAKVYYVDRFYENAQLWYASTLTDCALQLEVIVPEGLPDLRISYTTGDGVRHGKLLSQSGLDGSYILVDDDIEAVG